MDFTFNDLLKEEAAIAKQKETLTTAEKELELEEIQKLNKLKEEKIHEIEAETKLVEEKIARELLPQIHRTTLLTEEIKLEIYDYNKELEKIEQGINEYQDYLPLIIQENVDLRKKTQSAQFRLQLATDSQRKVNELKETHQSLEQEQEELKVKQEKLRAEINYYELQNEATKKKIQKIDI